MIAQAPDAEAKWPYLSSGQIGYLPTPTINKATTDDASIRLFRHVEWSLC